MQKLLRDTNGIIEQIEKFVIVCEYFWNVIFKNVDISLDARQTSAATCKAANPGYEIPKQLYSLQAY